ncbi:MAG: endonuclease V [Crenarchaeota archaeon]|nr:endonuclease V [Thermoproteota archaeon]
MEISIRRLIKLQRKIAEKIDTTDKAPKKPNTYCAIDAAYSRKYGGVAAAIACRQDGELIEVAYSIGEAPLKYIPGLLAFREAPLFYTAYRRLNTPCDILLIDGHGLSHPRRTGIATHIGMAVKKPTIGVAKSRLTGREKIVNGTRVLEHHGEIVAVIITHRGKDLYISQGAYISLQHAVEIVKQLLHPRHYLPIPIYHADHYSRIAARQLDHGNITPQQLREGRLPTDLTTFL